MVQHTRFSRSLAVAVVAAVAAACAPETPLQPAELPAFAKGAPGPPPFVFPAGCCYFEGRIVRTVVPPASTPNGGRDNFYGFPGAVAAGQKAIVGVIPGSPGYHGGDWKFFAVTWNVSPFLLTSEAAVLSAAMSGAVTITRNASADFKCPIQP